MRATWRWCAATSAAFRSCSPRRRRRSKAGSMPARAATTRAVLPARFARGGTSRPAADRHAPRAAGARRLPVARAARPYAPRRWRRGEQSLLFLNRRGYAPLTLCRVCGHRFRLPATARPGWSSIAFAASCVCHHCGHNEKRPEACPECGTLDHLVACGPGVERIAEEVVAHFPDARTIVLSSDLMGGVRRLQAGAGSDRQRRGRHRHRHAACRQGS